MNIILIMIPMALILLIAAGVAFFWATNHGQFDDMDSPGLMPVSDNLPEEDDDAEEPPAADEDDAEAPLPGDTANTDDTDDCDQAN